MNQYFLDISLRQSGPKRPCSLSDVFGEDLADFLCTFLGVALLAPLVIDVGYAKACPVAFVPLKVTTEAILARDPCTCNKEVEAGQVRDQENWGSTASGKNCAPRQIVRGGRLIRQNQIGEH